MISPSPWSVSEKRVYVKDANGENVCAVSRHDDVAVIAVAPEMLDLLRRFARGDMRLPHSEYDMELRAEARSLIEKADGRGY